MNKTHINRFLTAVALMAISLSASAQKYPDGIVDKTVAVIGNEMIRISQLEEEVNMMKAYGMITEDVEEILEYYFRACSIRVTAIDLARIGLVFANGGVLPGTKEALFDKKFCQHINAVLITSGMYDGSGEFALKVGIPAKSGVGGGIMAVVPGKKGNGIYSSALDKKGNSIAGVKALEMLSDRLELSVF